MTESPLTATVASLPPAEHARDQHQMPTELPVTVISARRGWFDWRLRELWRYRDLVSLFVWRDFVAIYKQTILGPSWHIVRPLLATFVFTIVFGRMAQLSTDGVPAFLFYLSGYVLWGYFSLCFDNVSRTFLANSQLMGKVYFHRLVIPVSQIISNLISFGIQLVLFVAVLIAYRLSGSGIHLTAWILATPLILCVLAGYALAAGLIVTAATTRYRDLSYLVTFGLQLMMYLTPVIYPVSSLSPRYRMVILANPLTPLVEGFRLAFLGVGTVTPAQLIISTAGMLTLLVLALMVFSRSERTFMDTV